MLSSWKSTSSSIAELQRTNHEELLKTFYEHESDVLKLQRRILDDVIPELIQQYDLDEDDEGWLVDYVLDIGTRVYLIQLNRFS